MVVLRTLDTMYIYHKNMNMAIQLGNIRVVRQLGTNDDLTLMLWRAINDDVQFVKSQDHLEGKRDVLAYQRMMLNASVYIFNHLMRTPCACTQWRNR
jgi:hypothetical protein